MNGKRLSEAEREDIRKHYLAVQKELLRRVQDCLKPQYPILVAIKRLKRANELADNALERLDRLATDQANYANLKMEAMEVMLLLGMLSQCESEAEVKLRRKQIRSTLEHKIFEKD